MGLMGFSLVRESEMGRLQESAVNLGHLKRELEDLGWNLLNMDYGNRSFAEQSPQERAKVYTRSVRYYLSDPLVGRNVDMLTDYAVGQGIGMPQTDNARLRQIFAEFWQDPENKAVLTSPEAQREKDRDLQMGGNIFWTAFVNDGDGHVRLSDIASHEIKDIITDKNNRRKTLYYKRITKPAPYNFKTHKYEGEAAAEPQITYYRDWRYQAVEDYRPDTIEEGLIFHLAVARVADSKFGFPLTMRILSWVQAYNEFMKARVALTQAAAMFAWKRKVKGNPAEVKTILQNFADRQFQQAGQTNDGGMHAPPPVQYGSVLSTNENVQWDQVKTDTGGANATADGRMIKGQVGAGYGFPLHYQGDIGGANLATATAMELPVLKMVEAHQMLWMNLMRDIHDFVIEQAIVKGELPAASKGRFTKEAIRKRGYNVTLVKEPKQGAAASVGVAAEELQEGELIDEDGNVLVEAHAEGSAGEYTYKIPMPKILQRQIGETINAMVNTAKAADPYGQNVDLSRWMLHSALEVLGEPEPEQVVMKVFPPGYKPPDITQVGLAERGRSDSIDGDGRGPIDFSRHRKPTSESAVGAKGGKRARTMDEVTEAAVNPRVAAHFEDIEAEVAEAIDRAYDKIGAIMEGLTGGNAADQSSAAATE
jgi:hypothetical protein